MLMLLTLLFVCVNDAIAAKPNIVIVFADDMGYGDASFSGNPTVHTPNLDKLAAEGMKFTQWYSGFHVCSPSRASMLTGRLPVRSGCAGPSWTGGVFADDAVGGLPQNETTFAKVLKGKGYASLAVGKWHVGQQPEFLPVAHGFDEYFGIPYSVDMGKSAWDNSSYWKTVLPLIHNTTVIEQPVNLDTLDGRYANHAVNFVKASARAGKPFLLYFACSHVHVPDYASKEFCKTSKRGRFGDAIAEMDKSIGTLMTGIKQAGVDNDTVVFFTSDNGPWLIQKLAGGSAGPLFEGKTTTWEGGIRVPGVVRWPGHVPSGSVNSEVVATYDIFATILALGGAEVPSDRVIDGRDLSGVLFRGEKSPHKCLFHYKGVPSTGLPPSPNDPQPGLWAIRCGAYKAHYVTQCAVLQNFGDKRCSSSLAYQVDHVDANPTYYGQSSTPIVHSPPLLYNIEHDLNEQYPISSISTEYQIAMARIENAKKEHEATLTPVPNQIGRGRDTSTKVCCNPHSKDNLPTYPNCTCNPENFDNVFVCSPVFPPTLMAQRPIEWSV